MDTNDLNTLGKRLRFAREKNGWSQTFVSQKLGIHNAVISNYERDYREPDVGTIKKMADLYNVTLDFLLGETPEPEQLILPFLSLENADNTVVEEKILEITSKEKKDLKNFLEQPDITFDGIPITEEDRQRLRYILTGYFLYEKETNQRNSKQMP